MTDLVYATNCIRKVWPSVLLMLLDRSAADLLDRGIAHLLFLLTQVLKYLVLAILLVVLFYLLFILFNVL